MQTNDDTRLKLATASFCLLVTCWLVYDTHKAPQIDYEWHEHLTQPNSTVRISPYKAMENFTTVLNQPREYLNSTSAMQRLYDMLHNLNIESPFSSIDQRYESIEQMQLANYPYGPANQTRCSQHLAWIIKQINNTSKQPPTPINGAQTTASSYPLIVGATGHELTQLMDSFGKPESGTFSGVTTWPGSYEQCKRIKLNSGRIRTRYCFARMRARSWPKDERAYIKSTIRIGACLPDTCDSSSFDTLKNKQKIEQLIRLELPPFYASELEFDSLFCLPDERSMLRKIPTSGYMLITVVEIWLALVITASILYELSIRRRLKQSRRLHTIDVPGKFALPTIHIESSPNDSSDKAVQAPTNFASHEQLTCNCIVHNFSQPCSGGDDRGEPLMNYNKTSDWNVKLNWLTNQIIKTMSIRNSIVAFKTNTFRVNYGKGERVRVNMGPIDGIKCLMTLGIILAHSALLVSYYSRSLQNRITLNTSEWGHEVLSIGCFVSIFFFIFGLLCSYTLMRKFTRQQLASPLTCCAINVGIFLRIAPIFMLVYWFARSIAPYIGEGPWWDYGVDKYSNRGACLREPWWTSIPYFGTRGSDKHSASPCNMPGWFIVSYTQLSWLMPILVYIIWSLKTTKSKTLFVLFMASVSACQIGIKLTQQTVLVQPGFTLYGAFVMDMLEKFQSIGFMSTLNQVGSVTIGCFTGYLLRQYELKHIQEWPAWMHKSLTLTLTIGISLFLAFLPLFGYLLYPLTHHLVTLNEFITSNVIVKIVFPCINGLCALLMTTSFNHCGLARFCSHSFWHAFSRLGLCIYLMHWEVLFIGITLFEHAPTYCFLTDIMKMWAFGAFFTTALAFCMHIFVETPIAELLNIVQRAYEPQRQQSSTIRHNFQSNSNFESFLQQKPSQA